MFESISEYLISIPLITCKNLSLGALFRWTILTISLIVSEVNPYKPFKQFSPSTFSIVYLFSYLTMAFSSVPRAESIQPPPKTNQAHRDDNNLSLEGLQLSWPDLSLAAAPRPPRPSLQAMCYPAAEYNPIPPLTLGPSVLNNNYLDLYAPVRVLRDLPPAYEHHLPGGVSPPAPAYTVFAYGGSVSGRGWGRRLDIRSRVVRDAGCYILFVVFVVGIVSGFGVVWAVSSMDLGEGGRRHARDFAAGAGGAMPF